MDVTLGLNLKRAVSIGMLFSLLCACNKGTFPEKQAYLNEAFLEWEIRDTGISGNKYDVHAYAIFSHTSGERKKSLMFYSLQDDSWKFRFTGTKTGLWEFETIGPGELGKKSGSIIVYSHPDKTYNGFLKTAGQKWFWDGSKKAVLPQLVMLQDPKTYLKGDSVDTTKIRETVEVFLSEHGFSGFHIEGGGYWFHINSKNLGVRGDTVRPDSLCIPDNQTLSVYEEIILQTYRQGGLCYIWLWGSDNSGISRSGPLLLGGTESLAAKRIQRYIAARLGPLPGWFMGYGYDLDRWAGDHFGDVTGAAENLQQWKDSLSSYLGGWMHPLGGRAHPGIWEEYPLHHAHSDSLFWIGDFASFVQFRPSYRLYCENLKSAPDVPCFQGDRFRIRENKRYDLKDYHNPCMVTRGLWHSTMAGGVGNIWGNLTDPEGAFDKGTVHGTPVNIKHHVKTYKHFWFTSGRYGVGMYPDNSLTTFRDGCDKLDPDGSDEITVCLRNDSFSQYVFYSENSTEIAMDLSASPMTMPAVAVDIKKSYEEMDIGPLKPGLHTWTAPYAGDWAIAVGNFYCQTEK